MTSAPNIIAAIKNRFGATHFSTQHTADSIATLGVSAGDVCDVLRFLKAEIDQPFKMLYDLTAIDERTRKNRPADCDFTVIYQVLSMERNAFVRLKVPLRGDKPSLPSIVAIWPCANWYEREVWDMFGISFDGHPRLERILMPPGWQGHPLRKEHPARATDLPPFELPEDDWEAQEKQLQFRPERWGLKRYREDTDFMFLNIGPNHASTHGVLRLVLQLDGEEILDVVPDIGFHHRGAEKMGERQSWHTYIPYTDRVDYLAGVLNNFPYVMAVEKLAGITVPDRVKVIRIMMAELFRIISHLVFYGTFSQDLGQMSPVFFMFTDREKALDIVQVVTGARMHPNWFRIGGLAADLPQGWDTMMRDFLTYMEKRLSEYDTIVLRNRIFKGRTKGVGALTVEEALDWGVTGPNLRACGLQWDYRKRRPYSGYEQFEFDIPTAVHGDCYDRLAVRIEEMRQSLRIIRQCVDNMPAGEHKARHPLTTPPLKDYTMQDIETLITHFLNVTWGPVIPAGEAHSAVESAKGLNGYYLVSDGETMSYRTRIRTPSFPHMQILPLVSRGLMVPDLVAILGSLDFVLGDVDR